MTNINDFGVNYLVQVLVLSSFFFFPFRPSCWAFNLAVTERKVIGMAGESCWSAIVWDDIFSLACFLPGRLTFIGNKAKRSSAPRTRRRS